MFQRARIILAARTFLYWRGVMLVQYWRSFEGLERFARSFARSKDDPYLNAWQRFNKAIGGDGSVGIFHETYLIQPDGHETVYANMPVFGLASAFEHTPVAGRRQTARGRLHPTDQSQPTTLSVPADVRLPYPLRCE